MDVSLGRTVFYSVVKENGQQPSKVLAVSPDKEIGGNVHGKGLLPACGHGLKGLSGLLGHFRKRKNLHLKISSGLLHTGKADEVIGQHSQTPGLVFDFCQPLIFAQIHFQNIRIGIYDG